MTASAALSLGYVAVYVVLAGVASFAEKPAGRGFGAFQLNALIRAGSLAAAAVALVFAHGLALPAGPDPPRGNPPGFLHRLIQGKFRFFQRHVPGRGGVTRGCPPG